MARSNRFNEKKNCNLNKMIYSVYTDSCRTPIYSLIKNDTLNVGSKLIEIIPIEYSKSRKVVPRSLDDSSRTVFHLD